MPARPDVPERRTTGGYPKSDLTRNEILAAALDAFAQHGFAAASTRGIARAAGVALPAIAYHFGSKQGLYLACARAIVERHGAALAAPLARAEQLLADSDCDPAAAREMMAVLLKAALRSFLDPGDGQARVDFAVRALRGPEAGLALLRDHVWVPGVTIIARLVAIVRNSGSTLDNRADALALISALLAFPLGRKAAAELLGVVEDATAIEAVEAAIDRQVAALR